MPRRWLAQRSGLSLWQAASRKRCHRRTDAPAACPFVLASTTIIARSSARPGTTTRAGQTGKESGGARQKYRHATKPVGEAMWKDGEVLAQS
eukprot:2562146-Alexandrium_andersonii.AAC.1